MVTKAGQVRFTLALGTGKEGAERAARWKEAAFKVHKMDRSLLHWVRSLCDAEADRILGKK